MKMVEYVLGGSPTTKDSPLGALEPRLRSLKFDDTEKVCKTTGERKLNSNLYPSMWPFQTLEEKEKQNSHFDTNGISKKDEQGLEEQGFK